MKKIIALIVLMIMFSTQVFAGDFSYTYTNRMYSVAVNTTTPVAITTGRMNRFYNAGAFDIYLTSATDSTTANKFTIKALTYLPFVIETSAPLYATAVSTASTLSVWVGN